MNAYIGMLVISFVAAGALGGLILARDPSERSNRLLAAALACSAFWSLCEILLNQSNDPRMVVMLIRCSSIGWVSLGPIVLDLFVEVTGRARSPYRKLVPFAYGAAAVVILMYITTPLFIHSPIRLDWGWSFHYGPLFPLAFLPTVIYVFGSLAMWPSALTDGISRGEQHQFVRMFFGILIPTLIASTTDVMLPYEGIHVPRLGSTSILVIGGVVAWSIRRYGDFLLSPGAFTNEILETLRDGVAMLDKDGRVLSCNEALAQLTGSSQDDIVDRPIEGLLPDLGLEPGVELTDFETTLVALAESEFHSVPVSVSSSPLRDDKDDVIGCVVAVRDLREMEAMRRRLVTSGRFAAVGELAAGIAHEINNPVTFVRANLASLRRDWTRLESVAVDFASREDLDPRLREGEELLEESLEGVDRVVNIVRNVGAISHAGIDRFEEVALNDLLDNTVEVTALSFSVSMERFYSDLPQIRCAPQQIKQVFLNLLINAVQAIGDYGSIRLFTSRTDDGVLVQVTDDGCGIESSNIDRVFDPFFTTQPVGEGTGLGLALSYQIVRSHGGDIRIESEVGVGTTVSVHLPSDPELAAERA